MPHEVYNLMGSMDRACLGVSVFFGKGLSEKKTGLKGGQEGAKWRNREWRGGEEAAGDIVKDTLEG